MNDSRAVVSGAYDHAIRWAFATQVIVGFLAAMVLDGEIMARVVEVAVLSFSLCAAVVIMRRPHEPSKFDLAFVQWGFWPILAIAALRQMLAG